VTCKSNRNLSVTPGQVIEKCRLLFFRNRCSSSDTNFKCCSWTDVMNSEELKIAVIIIFKASPGL